MHLPFLDTSELKSSLTHVAETPASTTQDDGGCDLVASAAAPSSPHTPSTTFATLAQPPPSPATPSSVSPPYFSPAFNGIGTPSEEPLMEGEEAFPAAPFRLTARMAETKAAAAKEQPSPSDFSLEAEQHVHLKVCDDELTTALTTSDGVAWLSPPAPALVDIILLPADEMHHDEAAAAVAGQRYRLPPSIAALQHEDNRNVSSSADDDTTIEEEVGRHRRFDVKSLKITVVDDDPASTWAGAPMFDRSFLPFVSATGGHHRAASDTPIPRYARSVHGGGGDRDDNSGGGGGGLAAAATHHTGNYSMNEDHQFSLNLSVRQKADGHHRSRQTAAGGGHHHATDNDSSYMSQSLSWSNNGSFSSAPLLESGCGGGNGFMQVTTFRRDLNEAEQRFRVAMDKMRTRSIALQDASSEASCASVQHGHTFLKMLAVEARRQNPGKVTPEKLSSLHRMIDERLCSNKTPCITSPATPQQRHQQVSSSSTGEAQSVAVSVYQQSVTHHADEHHSVAVVLATELLFFRQEDDDE